MDRPLSVRRRLRGREPVNPGCAKLYSRYPLTVLRTSPVAGAALSVRVHRPGAPVVVVATHLSNPQVDWSEWLADFSWLADTARGITGPLVVAGDFNAVPEHLPFERLLVDADLSDATGVLGRRWSPTFPSPHSYPTSARLDVPLLIDHVLVGGSVRVHSLRRSASTAPTIGDSWVSYGFRHPEQGPPLWCDGSIRPGWVSPVTTGGWECDEQDPRLCSPPNGRNPGMTAVDRAALALLDRQGVELTCWRMWDASEWLDPPRPPASTIEHGVVRDEFNRIGYGLLRGNLAEFLDADAVVYWGDFLHMRVYLSMTLDVLGRRMGLGPEVADEEWVARCLLLRGQTNAALGRTLSFGTTLSLDQPDRGDRYEQDFSPLRGRRATDLVPRPLFGPRRSAPSARPAGELQGCRRRHVARRRLRTEVHTW